MITPDKFGKILSKLPKEKVELEKVELARKAPTVAKDFEIIDSSFNSYKSKWQDFQDIIRDVSQERKTLENDVKEISQAAMDLGVSFENVKGLKESQDLSRKLDGLVKDLPKLYSEPK